MMVQESKRLTQQEEFELGRKLKEAKQAGGECYKATLDETFELYMPMVMKVAESFYKQCHHVAEEDLCAEGYRTLFECLCKHDFNENTRFSSYAMKAVRNSIGQFIDNNNRIIRIPSHKLKSMFMASQDLAAGDWLKPHRKLLDGMDFVFENGNAIGACINSSFNIIVQRINTGYNLVQRNGKIVRIKSVGLRKSKFNNGTPERAIQVFKAIEDKGRYRPVTNIIKLDINCSVADLKKNIEVCINKPPLEGLDMMLKNSTSIDVPTEDGGNLADLIEDKETEKPSEDTYHKICKLLAKSTLNDTQKKVIESNVLEGKGYDVIAKDRGVSKMRIRQIKDRVVEILKENVRDGLLHDFFGSDDDGEEEDE